jgi:hypothetical protein
VKVRLDRVVASPSWSQLFTGATMQHIVSSHSDHCPIMLEVAKEGGIKPPKRIFRYEIMWERKHSLTEEIQRAWGAEAPVQHLGDIAVGLKRMSSSLQRWSRRQIHSRSGHERSDGEHICRHMPVTTRACQCCRETPALSSSFVPLVYSRTRF